MPKAITPAEAWSPTSEMRQKVLMFTFNGLLPERIASILGLSLEMLRQHFARELEHGEEELLAWSAANIVELAGQRENLPVALQANAQMLQARKRKWRVPKEDRPDEADASLRPVQAMTLAEIDMEIAQLNAKMAAVSE